MTQNPAKVAASRIRPIAQAASTRPADSAFVVTTVLHQFAESLGAAADAKDPHTRQHSEEVAQLSHTLALAMGCPPHEADLIHVAAHLHDIGKIGIPDAILFKQTTLTPAEWALLRKHPAKGAEIVRPVSSLVRCGIADIILHHHERFDGRGYPDGLLGTAIPLGARIVALADTLSAMLQDRPYRQARSFDCAAREIERMAGTQFDPAVVAGFLRCKDSLRMTLDALKDEHRSAA